MNQTLKVLLSHLALLLEPTPQNGQTHPNNLLAVAKECFECVRPFCRAGF